MADIHLPSVILRRNLSRVLGLRRQLDGYSRRYADREDLLGVRLLLRALGISLGVLQSTIIEAAREPDDYAAPAVGAVPVEPTGERLVHIDANLTVITDALRDFESELEIWADLLSDIQGQPFDSLAKPFARLAQDVPRRAGDLELIFRPVPVHRYHAWVDVTRKFRDIVQPLDPDVLPALATLPELIAIEYPVSFEGDTFTHALIAHEIAHLAYDAGDVGSKIWSDAVGASPLEVEDADEHTQLFVEAACDLLAVRMIGPAYALAFREYILTRNVLRRQPDKDPGLRYPELPWRLARIDDAVDTFLEGAPTADSVEAPGWEASRRVLEEWRVLVPSYEILETSLRELLEDALKRLDAAIEPENILGDAAFQHEVFKADLSPIWRKMNARMAPAESIYDRDGPQRPEGEDGKPDQKAWSEPMDWRSILNVSYLRWLATKPIVEPPTLENEGVDVDHQRIKACELAQGAIELSELHREMGRLRGELRGLELPPEP